MWHRKILLLILAAGVVEPRPAVLQEQFLSPIQPVPLPFKFGYEVSASETGDTKSHQEELEDGVLRGSYTVVQPDGFRRIVNYVSDAEHGFRADVTFEKGYEDVIPIINQQASIISSETAATSLSQSSSESISTKKDSSSSANLEISDSLSTVNSASAQAAQAVQAAQAAQAAQGLSSAGFSNLVQVSDINNYGNAQYETSIDHSQSTSIDHSQSTSIESSHSTSDQTSFQDVSLPNNEVEIPLDIGLSIETTNLNSANEASTSTIDSTRHNSLEHYYTNGQVFCASCNTGSFGAASFGSNFESSANVGAANIESANVESANVISENNDASVATVEAATFTGNSENIIENNVVSHVTDTVVETPLVTTSIGDLFSRSFLVASENLESIDTVALANAGFDSDNIYAYKLVPVRIVQ